MTEIRNQAIKESHPFVMAPRGKIQHGRFFPVQTDREGYLQSRVFEAIHRDYQEFRPLNSPQLYHVDRIDSIDFYPTDMRQVISLFLDYFGTDTLYVIQGFRSPIQNGINAHTAGLAMDIAVQDNEEYRKVANAAYRAGIPNIVPGGDFSNGEGYVHIDISPKEHFYYEAGAYEGPWS